MRGTGKPLGVAKEVWWLHVTVSFSSHVKKKSTPLGVIMRVTVPRSSWGSSAAHASVWMMMSVQMCGQSNIECNSIAEMPTWVPCTNCITGVLLLVSRLERTRAK